MGGEQGVFGTRGVPIHLARLLELGNARFLVSGSHLRHAELSPQRGVVRRLLDSPREIFASRSEVTGASFGKADNAKQLSVIRRLRYRRECLHSVGVAAKRDLDSGQKLARLNILRQLVDVRRSEERRV